MGPKPRLTKNQSVIGKPSTRGVRRRKEDDEGTEWEMGDDFMQGKKLVKPEDQLDLNEKELKEEFTRILTANNPNAPQNIVRFSFKDKTYKPTSNVEQIAIHFALDGNLLHKDSDEARRQLAKGGPGGGQDDKIEEAIEEPEPEVEEGSAEPAEEGSGEKVEGEEGEGGEEGSVEASGEAKSGEEVEEARKSEEKKEEEEDDEDAPKPAKKEALRNQFNYSERASQTFNNPYRQRGTATDPPPRLTFSANANQWEIFDAYEADLAKQNALKEKPKQLPPSFGKKNQKKKKKLVSFDSGSDDVNRVERAAKIIERMVNQNTFDDIAQDYAYFEDASDEFRDMEGTLLPLWKFSFEKSKRLAVTSICWNPKYQDLFAVGQGSYDFLRQNNGMLLYYSLKNPSYPEFIYTTPSGVMNIDIHPVLPNLLCVGFYDGSVAVYNILEKQNEPTFLSTAKSGKHTDPVWQVKWQKNDLDDNLNFFSASADGRICSWSLVKDELIMSEIISLKIADQAPTGPDGSQLQILGCGTSLCFHKNIDYLYLVGTEEGKIHKCSKAYSTQFLDTIQAHTMAVEAITWNPYHPDVFISCSADWTVKVWDNNYGHQPMFIFDLNSPVGDVAWAPYSSTVFAAVTIDGKAHVFDLQFNKYEALCEQTVVQKKKTKLTHIQFNPSHPVVIVGDERGCVSSFKISPNLRKKPKKKKGEPTGPDADFEFNKLEKVLNVVRDPSAKQN